MINKERMLERFLKYVKIDTHAINDIPTTPSSPGQFELAKMVAYELKEIGVKDIVLTDNCFLFATIPSNLSDEETKKVPAVGFVSHFDTAPEAPGANVKPNVIKDYQGQTIKYSGNPELTLDVKDYPNLKKCIGHTIITTDGTTLLGGDDKAGMAALLELAHYFVEHPEEKHGTVKIGIMPDEETGCGADKMDLKQLGADVVYTLDGSFLGDIDIESFNGFRGKISVEGVGAFPGYGKGVYLNATKVLSEFVSEMPNDKWPENCAERQPMWWIDEFKGGVGNAEATVCLRAFDVAEIREEEKILDSIKHKLLQKYPKAKININIAESYKNFKKELDKDKRVVEFAEEAMKRVGVAPNRIYVRGGSDACHFCFSGVLSTNIFIGMQNMHSFKEWISLDVATKSAETAIQIPKVWLENTLK